MNYNDLYKDRSGIVVRTVSALVFLAFTFLWLYSFQADVMAYAQHLFSGGRTHYNGLVGALLIMLMLWLVQLGVYALVRLHNSFHALTYFPSMTALALLGALCPTASGSSSLSLWWLLLLPLAALWFFGVWAARVLSKFEQKQRTLFFTRSMWVNLLLLMVMMLGVIIVSDTNAVFHHRARMETCLLQQRYDDALQVGRQSHETDASLTMLRAYALSRQGQLPERLFQYPVAGSGADLVPLTGNQSQLLRYPEDSLYRHLGAIPRPGMTTAVADSLPLPRHYREALTLYTHSRSHPVLEYHDAVTDEDYANLQELEAQYTDPRERHIRVKENYQGSYWYYYEYAQQ